MARRHSVSVPASVADARLARARRDLLRWEDHQTFISVTRADDSDAWVRRLKRETGDGVVFEALARFGLAALHPRIDIDEEFAKTDFAEVQTIVWDRITGWYRLARRGQTPADQQRGARLLKRLGATLAAPRRGRPSAASKPAVQHTYKLNLRRLETADGLLKATPDGLSHATWRAKVAEACSIPSHALLGIRGSSAAGRTSLKGEALAWTAEHYCLSVGRVANILAKRRSRKE